MFLHLENFVMYTPHPVFTQLLTTGTRVASAKLMDSHFGKIGYKYI